MNATNWPIAFAFGVIGAMVWAAVNRFLEWRDRPDAKPQGGYMRGLRQGRVAFALLAVQMLLGEPSDVRLRGARMFAETSDRFARAMELLRDVRRAQRGN